MLVVRTPKDRVCISIIHTSSCYIKTDIADIFNKNSPSSIPRPLKGWHWHLSQRARCKKVSNFNSIPVAQNINPTVEVLIHPSKSIKVWKHKYDNWISDESLWPAFWAQLLCEFFDEGAECSRINDQKGKKKNSIKITKLTLHCSGLNTSSYDFHSTVFSCRMSRYPLFIQKVFTLRSPARCNGCLSATFVC